MISIGHGIVNTVYTHIKGETIKKDDPEISPLTRSCLKPLTLIQIKEEAFENKNHVKCANFCILTITGTVAIGICSAIPPLGILTLGVIAAKGVQLHFKDKEAAEPILPKSRPIEDLDDLYTFKVNISNSDICNFKPKKTKALKTELKDYEDKIKKNQKSREDALNRLSIYFETEKIKELDGFTIPSHGRPMIIERLSNASDKEKIEINLAYKQYKDSTNTIETKKVAKEKLLKEIPKRFVDDHYQDFSCALIKKIPNLQINMSLTSRNLANSVNLNNNGLKLSERDLIIESIGTVTIDRDEIMAELHCVTKAFINDILYNFTGSREKMAYLENGMLYSNKEDARYHDVVQVSKNIITLCDGSGHSKDARDAARISSKTAHNFLESHLENCSTTHEVLLTLMKALKEAANALEGKEGQTTYIQIAVIGNMLIGVSLGDSGAYIFRPIVKGGWTSINVLGNTKGTLNSSISGGQLGGKSDLDKTYTFAVPLLPGDVVYVCSDGIVDNLDPSANQIKPKSIIGSHILSSEWDECNLDHIKLALHESNNQIEKIIKTCRTGEEIARAISNFVQENTREKKLNFLINPDSVEKDFPGKLDDAAAGYFVYNPDDIGNINNINDNDYFSYNFKNSDRKYFLH